MRRNPTRYTSAPARSRRSPRTTRPRQPAQLPNNPTENPAPVQASAPQCVGAWFSLTPDQCVLLRQQEIYAKIVKDGRADEAFWTFKRSNRSNVGVAIALYACLPERDDSLLLQKALGLLRVNCVAIALAKGLNVPNADIDAPLDLLLTELLRTYRTPLDTARLLLKSELPDGRVANYGHILAQRLTRAFGYRDEIVIAASRLAGGIGEYIGALRGWVGAQQADPQLVEIIEELKRGLIHSEIQLWQAASERLDNPSLHWEQLALEFADARTGIAPTPEALRKQWARLRARLRTRYKAVTGQDSPTS